jgi:hypothetical protein
VSDNEFICIGTKFDIEYRYNNDADKHNVQMLWNNRGEMPVQGFDNAILEYVSE